jgi:hypothetical protein
MLPYNISHLFELLEKLSQTWISKKISEKKRKNKVEKKKAYLFLETSTIEAKCL